MKSRAAPTTYAVQKGATVSGRYKTADDSATGWWWLRSPGSRQKYAAIVLNDGSLRSCYVDFSSGCVRPALWVNLESGIF